MSASEKIPSEINSPSAKPEAKGLPAQSPQAVVPKVENADSALSRPKPLPKADRKRNEAAVATLAAKHAKLEQTMFLSLESILNKMDQLHGTVGNRNANEASSKQESSSSPVKNRVEKLLGYDEDGNALFHAEEGELLGQHGLEDESGPLFQDPGIPRGMRMLGIMHSDLKDLAANMEQPAKSVIRMAMMALSGAREELRSLGEQFPGPGVSPAWKPATFGPKRGPKGGQRGPGPGPRRWQ